MPVTITSLSGGPLYSSETASTIREAAEQAVASGADLSYTDLNSACLRGACLRGACLRGACLRGVDLSGADLGDAILSGATLRGATLRGACLRGVDLVDVDLRDAILSGAYLGGAKLNATIPTIPSIHQAVLAAIQSPGHELNMGSWHNCATSHCRAGWVIHLAGPAGKALEERFGPALAAALIYQASDPTMERVPEFHCSNDEALADIIACAEREAATAEVPHA